MSASVLPTATATTPLAPTSSGASKQYLTINQVLQRSRLNDPSHVKRMNVSGSALEDVSVMDQFPAVEVCSFAVNDISDLEPFRNCPRLQELYLRKNRIADFFQVLHLSHLPLRSIGLAENPITSHPDYRLFVISALPQLRKLDDAEVTPSERQEAERNIPDPFTAANDMGIASMPPMAGRPSSTAVQGNMLNSTSPPSVNRQQQQQQQQQEESPYDAFAKTVNSGSIGSDKKRQMMMRQLRFDEEDQQQQQQQLSSSSPPSLNMMMNNNKQQQQRESNRYNGDDVPIGGGGGGGVAAVKKTAPSSSSSTTSTLAQKRAQMKKEQQQQKNDFYTQETKVAVPQKSSSRPNTPSSIENTAPITTNQYHGSSKNTSGRNHHHHHYNPTPVSNNTTGFNEDAAVQAVKVLLSGMSENGLEQVKRYLSQQ